tara:strand:- start:2304 stop:8012 length:5709 start_codon:yes stop_codon:yes gene_type:complete
MEPFYYNLTLSDGTSITVASPTPLSYEEVQRIKKDKEENIKKTGGPIKVTGRVAGETVGGVVSGTSDILAGGESLDALVGGWILETLGFRDAAKWSRESQQRAAREVWGEGGLGGVGTGITEASRALAPDSTIGDIGGFLGGTGGRMVPLILGTWATGGGTALGMGASAFGWAGTQQTGAAMKQYEEIEMDRLRKELPDSPESELYAIAAGRAIGPALVSGAKTGVITAIGGAVAGRLGLFAETNLRVGPQYAARIAEASKQGILRRAGMAAAVEGVEEGVDEFVDAYFTERRYKPELWEGHGEAFKRIMKGVGAGAFFGGIIGGAGAYGQKKRTARELEEMKAEVARAIAPKFEAAWMKKLDEGKWIDPEIAKIDREQIRGKWTLRELNEYQELGRLKAVLNKDIGDAYVRNLTDPNTELSKGEQELLRKVGREAEILLADIDAGKKKVYDADTQKVLDEAGAKTVEELYDMSTKGLLPKQKQFLDKALIEMGTVEAPPEIEVATGAETLGIAPTSPVGISTPPVSEEVERGDFLVREGGAELSYGGAAQPFLPRVRESRQIPQVTPTPEGEVAVPYIPEVPMLEGEVSAEEQAAAVAEMEAAAIAKGDKPERFGPKGIVVKDLQKAQQAFGVDAPPAVETGPTKVADAGPDVSIRDPEDVSSAWEPEGTIEPPRAVRRIKKRIAKGKDLLSKEEKGKLRKWEKKLEKIQAERARHKAKREAKGIRYMRSGGLSDEQAIDAGIAAALVALKAGQSVSDSVKAGVAAANAVGFRNSGVTSEETEDRILSGMKDSVAAVTAGETVTPSKLELGKISEALEAFKKSGHATAPQPVSGVIPAEQSKDALDVALKVFKKKGSIPEALDAAYASLDGTSVSRGAFDSGMVQKMITAVDEMNAGNTIEGASAAAVATDTSVMPNEIKNQIRLRAEDEDKGISLLPDTSFVGKLFNMPQWLWNQMVGRQEDTLEYYGFNALAVRWNKMEVDSKKLAGRFASMVFDRKGGYNEAKDIMHLWTTIKSSELEGVEAEVDDYWRARHIFQQKKGPEPPLETLSPVAKNIVEGVGEAYDAMGAHARDETRVYVVDSKGNVKLGDFKLGKEGFPMVMKAEYRTVLENLHKKSKATPTIEFLIDRVGRTVKGVKDVETLVEWRDRHKVRGYGSNRDGTETTSQLMSQLEKKRENPLDADLLDFSLDAFLGYINNWSQRIAEIEAFGQGIDPAMDGKDAFEVVIEIVHKRYGKPLRSTEINALKRARAAAYRDVGGWIGQTGEKVAAGLESFASATMLTGVASAIRNGTGALQNVAGAYYAGNTSAALRALGRLAGRGANAVSGKLLGTDLIVLQDAAIDAAKLRSWGVLQQDLTHLMTGYEATATEAEGKGKKITAKEEIEKIRLGELSIIDVALRRIRKIQGIGLSITGFKGTEFTVRYDSALTARVLVADAIDAKRDKSNPQLLEEFRSFAGGMKGFDDAKINRLLKGDDAAMVDFVVRFVTDTQGGYTPNQLPFWLTTPMGRFMGKFMPYGIMMNQLHAKNIRRRFRKSVKKAGGDPDNMSDAVTKAKFKDLKAYGIGSLLSVKDLMAMAALFGGGGEAFWQFMASLFGMNRDVPTWHEIASGDDPLPKRMWDLAGRWYENIQYTGTMGAVMEAGEQGLAVFGHESKRQKDLLEPAGLAIAWNAYHYMQDAQSQEEYLDAELMEKYFEKQFSLWRYGKRATYRVSNAVELDWDRARRHKLRQDYYALKNAADRYADHKGMDTDSMFSGGGRFLPSPYKRFYTDIHDELYLGNTIGAREAALKVASLMGDDRDKSWSRVSSSVVSSQPLKVGGYTNTDIQNDFLKWAKRNLSYDDYASIVNLQQTYEGTARAAGLISGGNARVMRGMKIDMNKRTPKSRKKKPPDRIEEILRGY